jgi:methionine-rich copper-binding protein CopC
LVSSLSIRRLIALLGLSAVWLLLLVTPALAHAELLETDPSSGERLSQPPEQVWLRFNEPIEAEFTPVKVLDSQGNRVDRDNARVDPDDRRVLIADLEELPEGSYTVEWRVISADTHPLNGTYGFTVTGAGTDESQGATQAGAEDVGGSAEQPSDGAGPKAAAQNTSGGSGHIVHIVGLGLGILIFLALVLLRRG